MRNSSPSRVRITLIVILMLALLIRAVVALGLGDHATPISGASDQVSYDLLAQRVVSGNGFSFPTNWYPFTLANEPTAHWSFLYTLYLAGVYTLFGHHPLAARLIQVILSGLNIWLIYRLGCEIFNEQVGLVAAGLTGAYAYLIFFNAALMTQSFYVLAVLAALNLALSLARRPTTLGWLKLGAVIGLGVLLRQTLLIFTPILYAWLWLVLQRQSAAAEPFSKGLVDKPPAVVPVGSSRILSGMLLSVAVLAAFILPWTVRNYLTYHDFLLLNSNGGYWLYSSNHPNQGTNFDPNYVAPVPKNLRGLEEPAIDRALYAQAIGFILADPQRFVLLSLNRVKDYFWLLPSEDSSPLSNLSRVFSFALYLPFMVYGLFLSRREWRICLPLYLYVAFDGALCLLSWSAPRYRLPSDAVLMVFAGLAVADLITRIHLVFSMRATRSIANYRS